MKIMTTGPEEKGLPRLILGFFYLYFFLHWGTSILMFREKLGFSYETVVRYYLGAPELFMNPRSFQGMLEVAHFHLFAMGFFFVVFSHLLLFTPLPEWIKKYLILFLALALIGDMASGWMVRYINESFAWVKIISFWLLQGSSMCLLLGLSAGLISAKSSKNASGYSSGCIPKHSSH